MIRRADYVDLYKHSARCAGLDVTLLSAAEFSDFRLFHTDRLQRIWEGRDWVELKPVEKRYFRNLYATGTSYAQGAEVYHPGSQSYFQMLRTGGVSGQVPATFGGSQWATNLAYWAESETSYSAEAYVSAGAYVQGDRVYSPDTDRFYQLFAASSTGNAPTDTTRWGVLTEFDRYVAYVQTGRTAFEQAFLAWDKNPKNDATAQTLTAFASENGLQVLDDVPFCWVEFRLPVPNLSGDNFDATLTYAVGSQVYFEGGALRGNFYGCLTATSAGQSPLTTPASWSLVEIPFAFRGWLLHGAAADYARPDGNLSVADREERLAKEAWEQACAIYDAQTAHLHRTTVLTR